jgi:HPt (histidine-containing phosphotransfer) domain-containing protein
MPSDQHLTIPNYSSAIPARKPRPLVNPATGKRSWRHIIGVSLLAITAFVAAAFSIAFFIVNARVVYEYLFTGSDSTLKFVSEQAPAAATTVGLGERILSNLRRWSVDYSAMTPFKLSLFFVYLFVYSVRSLSGRVSSQDLHERARVLPFFRTLETTLVQLGLVGTIWGFLLIGWRMNGVDLTKGTTSALRILLDAFGTALLSTFTGVVLAYIFAPLIRRLWVWLHTLQLTTGGAADLRPVVSELSRALRQNVEPTSALTTTFTAARKPTEELTQSLVLLGAQIKVVRSDLERRGRLDELGTSITEIVTGAKSVVQALNGVAPAAGSLTKQVAALSMQIQKIADALAKGNPLAGLENGLDQTVQTLAGLQKVLGTLEATAKAEAAILSRIEATTAQSREAAKTVGSAITGVEDGLARLATDSAAIRIALGEISAASRGQMQLQSRTNELLSTLSARLEGSYGGFSAEVPSQSTRTYPIARVSPRVAMDPSDKSGRWPTWLGGRRR